jgi:hypothetical protein
MLPDKKIKCPYTAFTKSCFDGVTKHSCPKWVHVQGKNPNSGQPIDHYDCADAWVPVLLIENSQQQRQTGAAVESFRNEVLKRNAAGLTVANELISELGRGRNRMIDVTN